VNIIVAPSLSYSLDYEMSRYLLLLAAAFLSPLLSASFTISQQRHMSFATPTSLKARVSSGRGLDRDIRTASPQAGGMSLYIKPGIEDKSHGDCPFAQYIRMVMEELGLEHEVLPVTPEDKPQWLLEHYEGKLPCLRHRSEAYVESDVIVQYLDYFFGKDKLLGVGSKEERETAAEAADLFGNIVRFFKCVVDFDGPEKNIDHLLALNVALRGLERHLSIEGRDGPFLTGDGAVFSAMDCSLMPKLYHLEIGLRTFKANENEGIPPIDLIIEYPKINEYMEHVKLLDSWKKTVYPEDVVVWGWSNAREN